MYRFTVTIKGTDRLGLRALCERHTNEHWIPEHLTLEEAEAFVADHFLRTVQAELAKVAIRANRTPPLPDGIDPTAPP